MSGQYQSCDFIFDYLENKSYKYGNDGTPSTNSQENSQLTLWLRGGRGIVLGVGGGASWGILESHITEYGQNISLSVLCDFFMCLKKALWTFSLNRLGLLSFLITYSSLVLFPGNYPVIMQETDNLNNSEQSRCLMVTSQQIYQKSVEAVCHLNNDNY